MIELGYIPPKILQCDSCGKVRVSGAWTRDNTVRVDVIWRCPSCTKWKLRLAQAKEWKAKRAMERRASQPHEVKPMTDMDWADLTRGK